MDKQDDKLPNINSIELTEEQLKNDPLLKKLDDLVKQGEKALENLKNNRLKKFN